MSYYFKIKIMLPEEDEQHFSERNLSKSELSEVTLYLQQKTSQGIPVKFRVSIFNAKEENKIMSVTINTKYLTEIDVIIIDSIIIITIIILSGFIMQLSIFTAFN